MNVSTQFPPKSYCIIQGIIVNAARQISVHFHPKDGKITSIDKRIDKPLIMMYKEYTDRLVDEMWVWRDLLAKRAHYAHMRDQLQKMEEGEFESQNGADTLEDLDPTML